MYYVSMYYVNAVNRNIYIYICNLYTFIYIYYNAVNRQILYEKIFTK